MPRVGAAPQSGPPAHQNSFAFKHNPNSRLTKAIAALPNDGVCARCHDIIEWRRMYRKFKPLTKPAKCADCRLPEVRRAYHALCGACAAKRGGVCPKCCGAFGGGVIAAPGGGEEEEALRMLRETKGAVPGLRERDRRALIRELEKGGPREEEEEGGKGGEEEGEEGSAGEGWDESGRESADGEEEG